MDIVYFLIKVVFASFFLSVLYRQSYNVVFFRARQPVIWMLIVYLIGFAWFFLGATANWSFNVVAWSSIVALLMNIPPKSVLSKREMDSLSDELTGVTRSRLKSRYGLMCYALGCVLGWVFFWSKVCNSMGDCRSVFS
jgi:small-conductance mechanosensitive channel